MVIYETNNTQKQQRTEALRGARRGWALLRHPELQEGAWAGYQAEVQEGEAEAEGVAGLITSAHLSQS